MKVSLVSITQPLLPREHSPHKDMTPEELVVYTARVSSPQNQPKVETAPRLLRYLISHGHWSPFEMVDLTIEIETSRAIAAQLLRHRSFSFQEFSQRYAEADLGFDYVSARSQDPKNRQNSIDDLPDETKKWFSDAQERIYTLSSVLYDDALDLGIAKECARFLLPLSTTTRLYMKGSVRSWIHYLQARTDVSTQLEHRLVAEAIRAIFEAQFPNVAAALKAEKEEA